MSVGKVVHKWKKFLSCLMAMLLVMLSCDNSLSVYAAEPEAYALGDEFVEGVLRYRVIDEENKYVEVIGNYVKDFTYVDKPLEIPETVVNDNVTYSVTRIGDSAFSECSSVYVIILPDSITEIGNRAFYKSEIRKINIPNNVTVIGREAFWMCGYLYNVQIPESVEKIDVWAFRQCKRFTSIIIPEGVKEIGEGAFEECWYAEEISLPSSLEIIGNNAFSVCGNNTDGLTVTMREGVKEIGSMAFSACNKIKEITIPSSVEKVGSNIFYDCKGLEKAIIEWTASSIPVFGFNNCKSLKNIEISNSVKYINNSAFKKCSTLESITMPASVISFSNSEVFNDCTSLREMKIAVNVNKDEEIPVTPIKIYYYASSTVFENVPADRKLVFLTADGKQELAGTSLVAAQDAYRQADDGDTTDDLWYGWKIGDIPELYNVNIKVKKDGEEWTNHGKKFLLKNENGYLIDDFQAENGTYTVCVAVGDTIVDTGVTVLVEDSDTSVTIEYFTVTFYDDDTAYGNDTAWGQQIVRKDDYAVKPNSDPSKDGLKFAGWKTDKEGSEAFDFGEGITKATNIYASWIKDSEIPTEPSKPTEPEEPTGPSKPTEPEEPTGPSKPTEPERPTDSNNPENPEAPADPNKPTNPETPTDSNNPENPEAPADPNKPTNPETPTDSNKPEAPEEPSRPNKPTNPETPTDSNKPMDPGGAIDPNKPIDSGEPSKPSTPSNPNESLELEEPTTSAPANGAEKEEKPKTGDTNHVEIYATAAMVAGLSYVMLIFAKRKEGMSEEEKNNRVSAWLEWAKKGSRARRYIALTVIFFILLYYHSIGKRLDLQWKEICGN